MPLNRSTGQMYPWVTHTFNPIRGRCPHACVYCYYQANKRYEKSVGPLRLVQKELKEDLGRPWGQRCVPLITEKTIFVGSSTDMWAQGVPDEWIDAVLDHCNRYPDNTYVFQSKNPERFRHFFFQLPPRTMLGTTIETNSYPGSEVISRSPDPSARARAVADLFTLPHEGKKVTMFVSIEPIMDFDLGENLSPGLSYLIRLIQPAFVSIGADSKRPREGSSRSLAGGRMLSEPNADQIQELIGRLSVFTEVRVKSNLQRLLPGLFFIT